MDVWFRRKVIGVLGFIAAIVLGYWPAQGSASEALLVDKGFSNACGPISCFAAATSVGAPITLKDMVERCQWTDGDTTSLYEMHAALAGTPGVNAIAVRTSPKKVTEFIQAGNGVAVLPIRTERSGPLNHAVCAVGFTDEGLRVVDFPRLNRLIPLQELPSFWDGEAILVSPSADVSLWTSVLCLCLPGIAFAALLRLITAPISRRTVVRCIMLSIGIHGQNWQTDQAVADESIGPYEASALSSSSGIEFECDLGVLNAKQKVTKQICIPNDTGSVLRFKSWQTTCGCISLSSFPKTIGVGSRALVELDWDTEGSFGDVNQSVLLLPPARTGHPVKIRVRGIIRGVAGEPSLIDFGRIRANQESVRAFRVWTVTAEDVLVQSISPSIAGVRASLRPVSLDQIEEERHPAFRPIADVDVQIDSSELPAGPFSAELSIRTDHEQFDVFDVGIRGYVDPDVRFKPSRIVFGLVDDRGQVQRSVSWFPRKEHEDWRIDPDSLRSDNPYVSVQLSETNTINKRLVRVLVSLDPSKIESKGVVSGEIEGSIVREGERIRFGVPFIALTR